MSKPPPYSRPRSGWLSAFTHAWNGIIHTVVHQPHMRVHVISGMLVGLVGSGIPLGLAEKVTLIFCVILIFFAEILNSALEQLVDLAIQQFDEKARVTKDAAAAGVLVLALGTVVIFAAILVHNWDTVVTHGPEIRRQVILGVPFTVCGGFLMHSTRRPPWIDVGVFFIGCALLAALSLESQSAVFTTLTFSLLVIAGGAAREGHRFRATQPL